MTKFINNCSWNKVAAASLRPSGRIPLFILVIVPVVFVVLTVFFVEIILDVEITSINSKTFRILTDRWSPEGKYGIGMLYYNGDGFRQDFQKAREWLQKAADGGNDKAMFQVGFIYRNGSGVARDPHEALKWFEKAAVLGNVNAMYNIGVMYETNPSMPPDETEAARWYRKAAELGDAKSQGQLGTHLFRKSNDNEPERVEAYMWLLLAERQGDPIGKMNRISLANHLSPEQFELADKMFREWQPKK